MKQIILILMFCLGSLDSMAQNNTPAQQLIERMQKLQAKGVMYGHQDDCFYGLTWEWDEGRSETFDLVGDYPGVMGFDLGGIEMGDLKNLDSVPFTRIRQEAIRQYERGGIITFSWHPRNPLLSTTAWIESDIKEYEAAQPYLQHLRALPLMGEVLAEASVSTSRAGGGLDPKTTVRECLPGGRCHEKFELWLGRVALFLSTIRDNEGRPIPFIFRPWHENNGGWFWWGEGNCSSEEYRALWNMTQDYIRQYLPDNIVWSYSPNLYGMWTMPHFLERYPGNERCDLLGLDAYQWGTEEAFVSGVKADLSFLVPFAQDNGLLFALTECGYKNSPDPTWWSRVFLKTIEDAPACYILPWRNYKKEHFGASKDASTADDFRQLQKSHKLLFTNDIKKIK